jgi:diguanylate cyclase
VSGEILIQALEQSDRIHVLITQSADELRLVHAGIEHALANPNPRSAVKSVLDKNEAVARQLQDASAKLAEVSQALRIEIRDRSMVDHQLAAAVEQEEGSRSAALHDKLTALPNRVLFTDRLEQGIVQAKRHQWILAVMFLDLDKFKSINDTYGHQTGDAALQAIATRLRDATRKEDTISRFGGDEFLCVLTQFHERNEIAMIAAKVLKAIQAPCDLPVGDAIVKLCLEATIGISMFPKDGASAAELIKCADEAMYRAKETKSGFAFAQ